MEKSKHLETIAEDAVALQSWPLIQSGFFPGQSCKDIPRATGGSDTLRLYDSSSGQAMSQSPCMWEQLSRLEAGKSNDPRSSQWKDSWEWDGFLFAARPTSTAVYLDNSQGEAEPENVREPRFESPCEGSKANGSGNESTLLELGLRNTTTEDEGFLALKLGGNGYHLGAEGDPPSLKRSRHSPPETQQPRCQVDNCSADLHNAKDYHRRHKVCAVHAKALKAPVARIMQRFCQQCSRFHVLQEFDEDRRSCRRRLAGHNRRRRKTQPDATAALAYLLQTSLGQVQGKDELERLLRVINGGEMLLQTLLRAKSTAENVENQSAELTGTSNGLIDAVAKTQILNNLLLSNSSLAASVESPLAALSSALLISLPNLLQNNGQLPHVSNSKQQEVPKKLESSNNVSNRNDAKTTGQHDIYTRQSTFEQPVSLSLLSLPDPPLAGETTVPSRAVDKANQVTTDLLNDRIPVDNDQTVEVNHCLYRSEGSIGMVSAERAHLVPTSVKFQMTEVIQGRQHEYISVDSQDTPPEESVDIPALGSDQSSDTGLEIQERTYRIWFKLLDRGPGELPSSLRRQISEWLDHLPTDMESYVRPGCVILTIFLCIPVHAWEKLCKDIEGSLSKLVQSTNGEFWRRGRILVQLGKACASIIEGKVYSNTNLQPHCTPHLLLVRPFAVVMGENVELVVRGHNLKVPGTKVICAYGGKYVDKEGILLGLRERKRERDNDIQNQEMVVTRPTIQQEQALTFHVGPFNIMGRGFIEVEGEMFKGNTFPIIVADKSICEEICSLEEELETSIMNESLSDQNRLRKVEAEATHFLYELGWLFQRTQWRMRHSDVGIQKFSSARFIWILRFAVEHGWCAVTKKVLDLLFSFVDKPTELEYGRALKTLSEVNLLLIAVRTNSRPMVEALLAYSPPGTIDGSRNSYIFRPDMPGVAGLTPLHIAASMHAADEIIDALTNVPEQLWVSTWISAKDSVGQTPLMYALAAGNHAYVKTVQIKLQKIGRMEALRGGSVDDTNFNKGIPSPQLALDILSVGGERKGKMPDPYSSGRLKLSQMIGHCTCKGGDLLLSQNHPLIIRGKNGSKYRPFVLSMLAVAAVCVCVGVLMKGPPNVAFVRPPFVWDYIKYGFI